MSRGCNAITTITLRTPRTSHFSLHVGERAACGHANLARGTSGSAHSLDTTRRCHYRKPLMLKWCRTRASGLAPVLLVSLLALAAPHTFGAHHDSDSEIAPIVVHDHAAHRVGSASGTADPSPQHCAVCHWSRSFRLLTRVPTVTASCVEAARIVPPDPCAAADNGTAAQPPLRAPPAVPSLA
jgi:hypothetical protein